MTLTGRSLSRALLALPSTALGGTERHSAVLAGALAKAGVAVTILLEPGLVEGFRRLPGAGPQVRLRPAPVGWQPEAAPEDNIDAQAAALAETVAEVRPGILILPLPWPTHGLGLLRGALAAGLPTLAIQHLAPREPEPLLAPAAQAVAEALPGAPIRWVAVAAPVAERAAAMLGLPPAIVSVVPNGVQVPREDPAARAAARARQRHRLGLGPEARLLLFAGRLEWKKGADLLPEVAERLAADCSTTLVALGDGPMRGTLEGSGAARRGGPLRLAGHVGDVPDWLLAADALLLPSRLEGCPLVFLEAAARRCPVIASSDAVECFGAEAGRLAALAAGGSIAHLTDHVVVRLNDPAAARPAVDAAFRTAVAHDEAAMLRRYFSLIRAALV